jgi:hypothetical protein
MVAVAHLRQKTTLIVVRRRAGEELVQLDAFVQPDGGGPVRVAAASG